MGKKKGTIPNDAVTVPDADSKYGGQRTDEAPTKHEPGRDATGGRQKGDTKETGLVQVSTRIDADIAERARNIVWQERGLTLAAMVKEGLEHVVKEWERANGGRAPKRPTDKLPSGRPLS